MTLKNFAWQDWYNRFDLDPDELSGVRNWYPRILELQQTAGADTIQVGKAPLSAEFVYELLKTGENPSNPADNMNYYIETGELGAASTLLKSFASSSGWENRVNQKHAALEHDFDRLKSQLSTYHRNLTSLGVTTQGDPEPKVVIDSAENLFQLGRLGPAIKLLKEHVKKLEHQIEKHRQRIKRIIEKINTAIEHEPNSQWCTTLFRLSDEVNEFLDKNRLPSAERIAQQAQVLYKSRDLTQFKEQSKGPEDIVLREPFPDIRTQDILNWLQNSHGNTSQKFKQFLARWRPIEWEAEKPQNRKEDQIYETLYDLGRLRRAAQPFAKGRDHWTFFLRDLFNLIGKRGLEPDKFDEILIRTVDRGRIKAGYWLGRISKEFSIPYTFLTPERLQDGLPVIVWHRPNDATCPSPANLQNELGRKGLTRKPILFLAGDTIYSEDRDELRRVFPTAALLDERDLLQIIFCSERPEIRAMHFARSISRQLPPDSASPFNSDGDVASAMFVGRKDVLQKFSDANGPTILFGGRKLGKSSIFRQLHRDFEKQAKQPGQNVAIYFNAINVVDGNGIKNTLLPEIIKKLNHVLIHRGHKGDAAALDVHFSVGSEVLPEDFATHMRNLLRNLPEHRFLFLIDEADSLLLYLDSGTEVQQESSKRLGWTFRALIQESQGRFDIRFAGFQDISRVTQSTAGPFYNFRSGRTQYPLTVLEPDEAHELIVRPLQILDTTFSDDSLVHLISDYTGQHPSLIQKFCSILYPRVRRAHKDRKIVVTDKHIESVWKDPVFRKAVVRAVHLNVETRNTKPEMILRLLLYLWVYSMMAPSELEVPVVANSTDFYNLLRQKYGEDAVREQVSKNDLDKYLADLATLGVLKKYGHGYAFHYHYFARLLYYDHFQKQLGDRELDQLWERIITHEDFSPRMPISVRDRLSISPFTKLDQEKLESETQLLTLVLGAPGTGKTHFFEWLQKNQAADTQEIVIVDATDFDLEMLKDEFVKIFQYSSSKPDWQDLSLHIEAYAKQLQSPILIVIDNINKLADDQDLSLLYWPEVEDSQDDGLIFMLSRLTKLSNENLRFVMTGTFPLARFWIYARDVLLDQVNYITTQSLTRQEMDAWFTGTRLFATNAVKDRIWNITKGDWRLLSSLQNRLKDDAEELNEADVDNFEKSLRQAIDGQVFSLLHQALESYNPRTKKLYRRLNEICEGYGTNRLTLREWCEILSDDFTESEVETELNAAVLLGELKKDIQQPDVIAVPTNHTFFQLVIGTDV